MKFNITDVTVLGAGVMGCGIAAHLASAGIKVNLLDMVPPVISDDDAARGLSINDKAFRNKFAINGKNRVCSKSAKAISSPALMNMITVGNFEDDLDLVKSSDWVVEVIVEELEAKKELLRKVSDLVKPNTIISTNTSGVSINAIAEALPLEQRKYFLGTHFFNPVRQMKLFELIPCKETCEDLMSYMSEFARNRLGKGVVVAKDTPAFIANRIGAMSSALALKLGEKFSFTQDRVDFLTSNIIGRPMGVFSLMDLTGLDVSSHVCENIADHVESERDLFTLPDYFGAMVNETALGNKVGKGFYMKDSVSRKKYRRNLETGVYEEFEKYTSEQIPGNKGIDIGESISAIIESGSEDGKFLWDYLKNNLLYCMNMVPAITDDFRKIDLAMKWGYNWKYGPFELFDQIGPYDFIKKAEDEACTIPAWVKATLASRDGYLYEKDAFNGLLPVYINLKDKVKNTEVMGSDEVSLRDIGDGVACIEFHSKGNSLSNEMVPFIIKAMDVVEKNFAGVVIGNQGKFFCGGAKLDGIYELAIKQDWNEMLRQNSDFHEMTMRYKFAKCPVVSAAFGSAMGGGCETVLHSTKVVAHADLQMGLVEARLGLLPGGGGCKEMTVRAAQIAEATGMREYPLINTYVKQLFGAVVAYSAENAFEQGYLRRNLDKISMNQDNLIDLAKKEVIYLADGFRPAIKKPVRVLGTAGEGALAADIFYLKEGGYISEYDAHIAEMIAWIMTGGGVSEGSYVSEDYLNKLEGEAFVELCHHPETLERIKTFLETGKFIKN